MISLMRGNGPLVLALPHCGQEIPPFIMGRMNADGRAQTDISWHLEEVLDLAEELDATLIRSTISRYVIDLDVAANDSTANSREADTNGLFDELCPLASLSGDNIYQDDEEPGAAEIEQRFLLFHAPFHRTLSEELQRLSQLHDRIVLFDCKSIRSRVPDFTDHGLPVFSIGAEEKSCIPRVREIVLNAFSRLDGFSVAEDGLATTGHIRRTYGNPENGINALSLMIAQRAYLLKESAPYEPDQARIRRMKRMLTETLSEAQAWALEGRSGSGKRSQASRSDDILFDDGLLGPQTVDPKG